MSEKLKSIQLAQLSINYCYKTETGNYLQYEIGILLQRKYSILCSKTKSKQQWLIKRWFSKFFRQFTN